MRLSLLLSFFSMLSYMCICVCHSTVDFSSDLQEIMTENTATIANKNVIYNALVSV